MTEDELKWEVYDGYHREAVLSHRPSALILGRTRGSDFQKDVGWAAFIEAVNGQPGKLLGNYTTESAAKLAIKRAVLEMRKEQHGQST